MSGVGLFCPARCTVTIRPAPFGHGLRFLRTDFLSATPTPAAAGAPDPTPPRTIPATVQFVVARQRQTVLALPPLKGAPHAPSADTVQTVEHLLSALAALGITDALIEVTGPEIPLADGSALVFVTALRDAGIVTLPGPPVPPLVVSAPIDLTDGDARVQAWPIPMSAAGPTLEACYHLDYGPAGPIPVQSAAFDLTAADPDIDAYAKTIAPARTFCTKAEALALRGAGLFAHLTAKDVPVIGPDGPVEGSLRFHDEPARHKLLDLLGDLSLAGRPIHARVVATRSGHALNHRLAAAILAQADRNP